MSLFNSLMPVFTRQPSCQGSSCSAEQGSTNVKPLYEITETNDAWGLTVQLPGVTKEGLDMSVDQTHFRIVGRKAWKTPQTWTSLYRESASEDFELALQHDNAIDHEKIHAELKDGILRVSLPKAAEIKPRKISIN